MNLLATGLKVGKMEDWIWPPGTCYIISCHCAKFITSQNGIIYWNILLNKGNIWPLHIFLYPLISNLYNNKYFNKNKIEYSCSVTGALQNIKYLCIRKYVVCTNGMMPQAWKWNIIFMVIEVKPKYIHLPDTKCQISYDTYWYWCTFSVFLYFL